MANGPQPLHEQRSTLISRRASLAFFVAAAIALINAFVTAASSGAGHGPHHGLALLPFNLGAAGILLLASVALALWDMLNTRRARWWQAVSLLVFALLFALLLPDLASRF
jgi:heme/copper-type cytochrome/quinol oxidase subunit 3